MNDELLDHLARRLRRIGHHCDYCANSEAPPDEYWLMMAREVTRLMEYAWSQGHCAGACDEIQAIYEPHYFDIYRRAGSVDEYVDGKPVPYPLYLAPEDWKP